MYIGAVFLELVWLCLLWPHVKAFFSPEQAGPDKGHDAVRKRRVKFGVLLGLFIVFGIGLWLYRPIPKNSLRWQFPGDAYIAKPLREGEPAEIIFPIVLLAAPGQTCDIEKIKVEKFVSGEGYVDLRLDLSTPQKKKAGFPMRLKDGTRFTVFLPFAVEHEEGKEIKLRLTFVAPEPKNTVSTEGAIVCWVDPAGEKRFSLRGFGLKE